MVYSRDANRVSVSLTEGSLTPFRPRQGSAVASGSWWRMRIEQSILAARRGCTRYFHGGYTGGRPGGAGTGLVGWSKWGRGGENEGG